MAAHLEILRDFWTNKESLLLLNPRLESEKKNRITLAVEQFSRESVIWLKSSGTESSREGKDKIVCLHKSSFLKAAESVNAFYQITDKDVWLNALPLFHVGGLSISARCFLSGASELFLENWSAESCYQHIEDNHVSVISLVPTQVYDLVKLKKKSPKSLRLIIVGGGSLSEILYEEARQLGWPIVPSYGMTETCAMIAGGQLKDLGSLEYPCLKCLKHVQLLKEETGYSVKSPSLYEGYLFVSQNEVVWEPRNESYPLDDLIELEGTYLKVLGRESDLVKILGETVNIKELENKLQKIIPEDLRAVAIKAFKDDRRGYKLVAFVEGAPFPIDPELFNQRVMPYERIEEIIFKDFFPRTDLGKIKKYELTCSS